MVGGGVDHCGLAGVLDVPKPDEGQPVELLGVHREDGDPDLAGGDWGVEDEVEGRLAAPGHRDVEALVPGEEHVDLLVLGVLCNDDFDWARCIFEMSRLFFRLINFITFPTFLTFWDFELKIYLFFQALKGAA